jgi:Putative bacterial sensory transduction regulator
MNEIVRLIPTPQSHMISEGEVSLARLQSVLETAVFDVKMDRDGDLYVTDGLDFPSWVRLPEDEKLIIFVTYQKFDDPDEEDWPARMNEINHRTPLVQFHWCGNAIFGHYAMSYEGGLNGRQFIKMLRRFSSTFAQGALLACDKESEESDEEQELVADPESQWESCGTSNVVVLHPRTRNNAVVAQQMSARRAGNVIVRFIMIIWEHLQSACHFWWR